MSWFKKELCQMCGKHPRGKTPLCKGCETHIHTLQMEKQHAEWEREREFKRKQELAYDLIIKHFGEGTGK